MGDPAVKRLAKWHGLRNSSPAGSGDPDQLLDLPSIGTGESAGVQNGTGVPTVA